MLGDDLTVVDGAEVGAWIRPALGDAGTVEDQVPQLFEAYARVFHPASDGKGNDVTWAEVARRLGRVSHPAMQWHQIVGTADTFGIEGSNWSGEIPWTGEMGIDDLDRFCAVLAEHTADAEHCYFGLCGINNHPLVDKTVAEQGDQPRLKLPVGRDHLVLAGPLAAVVQIGDTDPPGLMVFGGRGPNGEPPERPEPDPTDPFWREAPSLIWPADRSWFAQSEVDFDSTIVGGSRTLVDALVAAPGLEVLEVTPETKLTAFSDQLNPVARPPEPPDQGGDSRAPRFNLELKARDPDPARSLEVCRELGAVDEGTLAQRDTYFEVPRGRLKLREELGGEAQLIAYQRPDLPGQKESRYRLVPFSDPVQLTEALASVLDIRIVVSKTRRLFTFEGVRIHLDHVGDLGTFIEFEAVVADEEDLSRLERLLDDLRRAFGIEEDDLLATGYSDLLEG